MNSDADRLVTLATLIDQYAGVLSDPDLSSRDVSALGDIRDRSGW